MTTAEHLIQARECVHSPASKQLERDRYDAMYARLEKRTTALRKIAAWKGYEAAPTWFESDSPLTEYETGANDMLETLQAMAKEALA